MTKIFNTIHDLYKTPDLYGDLLTQPLKAYESAFSHQETGWKKAALTIIHIATGVFAYPILGLVACLGVTSKVFSIPFVLKHNERIFSLIDSALRDHNFLPGTHGSSEKVTDVNKIFELKVSKAEVTSKKEVIKSEISKLTHQFRLAYFDVDGSITQDNDKLTVQLFVR